MNRRIFLATAVFGVTAAVYCGVSAAADSDVRAQGGDEAGLPEADYSKLPKWRGFNLLEKFQVSKNSPFVEKDFELIHRFGFNFVRLPMDYRCWIVDGDWNRFNESVLSEIDQAVEWGGKYGIHVLLNFHRAPGYTVAKPAEKTNLWDDAETQKVCAKHWAMFARRYKGISNKRLSFNLFNEPGRISGATYAKVVGIMVSAIRAEDPQRLIICDGLEWGRIPCTELMPLKVAQATRGYEPFQFTHYKATWVGDNRSWPVPQWPVPEKKQDADGLWQERIEPWKDFESSGFGVMVGEWGAYRYTPHDVVLRWMGDCLRNWQKAGWGWALWNFRGPFGVMDSDREDVQYEDYEGHKLDRRMLELLQKY